MKKICVQCKHHDDEIISRHYCNRNLKTKVDLVTGKSLSIGILDCREERKCGSANGKCGVEGKFYENQSL